MAVIFSPLNNEELQEPFKPLPSSAFLMIHSSTAIAPIERAIERAAARILKDQGFKTRKANTEFGSKDYLQKIINLIRGCGFGVAIFSEFTPAPTLANIFFEIGISYVLGKDVVIIKTKDGRPPSDFVRNEWIEYDPTRPNAFEKELRKAASTISDKARFFRKLGTIALEAEDIDYELAFERFRQSILIERHQPVVDIVKRMSRDLNRIANESPATRNHLRRTRREIASFLKLLPRG